MEHEHSQSQSANIYNSRKIRLEENEMKTQDTIINKIKKLLALAGNNPSEQEAQAAYAKAQALMAQYSIELSEESGEEVEIVAMQARHKDNCGYRKSLAVVIANNFRVKAFMSGNTVTFFGTKMDVEIAKEVFEHAYNYAYKRGFKLERDARKAGENTHGLANSYFSGFIAGLKAILDEQCKALMIITLKEVEDAWEEKVKGMKKGSGGQRFTNGVNYGAYMQGFEEGQEHMRKTKSLE